MQQSLESIPLQLQYHYDTFNCLKHIQSLKELTKCKQIRQYDEKSIDRILQANLQQSYFLFLSSKYRLKIYKEKDLFFTPTGNIAFFCFSLVNDLKLAKITNQINLQNLFQNLQQLIQKMHNKLKQCEYSQFSLLEAWKELLVLKKNQNNQGTILNSEIFNTIKNLNIFQKNSLKARIQGSVLINKFDQIEQKDKQYLKKHFIEFKQIIEGCYTSIQQKQKQANVKMSQILIDLSKCRFFQCFKANQESKQKFLYPNQIKQIQYLKQSFIISLQICDCQSQHIKHFHLKNKQKVNEQYSKSSENHQSSQKQKLSFKICFIGLEIILVKMQTRWKISENLFQTEFKKKIKDIIQNVNQIFLTNLQAKTIQLQDFDIQLDLNSSFVYIILKTTAQKNQICMYNILKVLDQLIILYLAFVKVSLYYQILSFDYIQRYSLNQPTKDDQINLVRNIHGYWGLLFLKYQDLKGSFLQQAINK